jgi:Ca2+-binding EF-hand superfamily protein
MRLLNISPTKSVLEEVFNQVISTNVITRDERKRLRNVLSVNYLDDDEYILINRLVERIRSGWVKLVE